MKKRTIYFVRAVDGTGPIKVGIADDPQKRLATFQAGCPVQLRIIGTIPGTLFDERAIHEVIADDRQHGEWFSESLTLRQIIASGIIPADARRRVQRIIDTQGIGDVPQPMSLDMAMAAIRAAYGLGYEIGLREEVAA